MLNAKIIGLISYAVWTVALCVALLCLLWSFTPEIVERSSFDIDIPIEKEEIRYSFASSRPLAEVVSDPLFDLRVQWQYRRLPDLRSQLVVYDSRVRPDMSSSPSILVGLRGREDVYSKELEEKVFLRFFPSHGRWMVSEEETPLFVVFEKAAQGVHVRVSLKDEHSVVSAATGAQEFDLSWTPRASSKKTALWELGSWVVSSTLLADQGAVWMGQDVVVQELGGEAMAYEAERERIQSIESIKAPGFEALIAEQKYNPDATRQSVAEAVLNQQEAQRTEQEAQVAADRATPRRRQSQPAESRVRE